MYAHTHAEREQQEREDCSLRAVGRDQHPDIRSEFVLKGTQDTWPRRKPSEMDIRGGEGGGEGGQWEKGREGGRGGGSWEGGRGRQLSNEGGREGGKEREREEREGGAGERGGGAAGWGKGAGDMRSEGEMGGHRRHDSPQHAYRGQQLAYAEPAQPPPLPPPPSSPSAVGSAPKRFEHRAFVAGFDGERGMLCRDRQTLTRHFLQFGQVVDVFLPKGKPVGFVAFEAAVQLQRALDAANHLVAGVALRVTRAEKVSLYVSVCKGVLCTCTRLFMRV